MNKPKGKAAADYADRVEAVLEQRTRLRGVQPSSDLWAALTPSSSLLVSDPHRPLDANLEIVASYIEPGDVIVDVGGGTGRISLPLALRCKALINIEPSPFMGEGFLNSALKAGINNVRFIQGEWPSADAPVGTVALVNNVTYMTRDIVPFLLKLEQVGGRRVLITVNSPPPPARQQMLFQRVHGEAEATVPGHPELMNVLWEMGRLPDLRVLPLPTNLYPPEPTRGRAINNAITRFGGEQWSLWPLGDELEARLRSTLEADFDELFAEGADGFRPLYFDFGREVLITWQPTN